MKKSIVILIFCISNFVNAQGVRYGLKGGLNVATILGTEEKVSPKMGFHIGGLAEFQIGDKIYLQPEILFSVLGASKYIEKVNNETRLSYATIPLIAKYYLTGGFCVELGPYASFIASATKGKKNIIDDLNSLDYGISGGINYILPNSISFGARANVGLSELNNNTYDTKPMKNLFLQLSIGYFL